MMFEDEYRLPSTLDDRCLDTTDLVPGEPTTNYRSTGNVAGNEEEGIAWAKIVRDHYNNARFY